MSDGKHVDIIGWKDAPHLQQSKAEELEKRVADLEEVVRLFAAFMESIHEIAQEEGKK